MSSNGEVRQERLGTDDNLLLVIVDRLGKGNSYTTEMLHQLDVILCDSSKDPRVRAAVVTGAGTNSFCSGADLDELRLRTHSQALDLDSRRIFKAWAEAPWPTVAAVNGNAVGGGVELALACDLRVCAPHAGFSFPETSLSLIPAAGGTQRLPAVVGPSRSKEMILFGRLVDATTALAWGLVSEIHNEPTVRAIELADIAARRDTLANRLAKSSIDRPLRPDALEYEGIAQALLYDRQRHRHP